MRGVGEGKKRGEEEKKKGEKTRTKGGCASGWKNGFWRPLWDGTYQKKKYCNHSIKRTSSTSNVASQVWTLQNESQNADEKPAQPCEEGEETRDEKDAPDEDKYDKNNPEYFRLVGVDECVLFVRFKNPFIWSVRFNVIPPSKASQETSSDVFRSPKVESDEANANDQRDELLLDFEGRGEPTSKKIAKTSSNLEGDVENQCKRMFRVALLLLLLSQVLFRGENVDGIRFQVRSGLHFLSSLYAFLLHSQPFPLALSNL